MPLKRLHDPVVTPEDPLKIWPQLALVFFQGSHALRWVPDRAVRRLCDRVG